MNKDTKNIRTLQLLFKIEFHMFIFCFFKVICLPVGRQGTA